ncbi:MAG TPA: protein-L-isoaspartate(D-aspartate) O-methyltransferase [Steroidobacteraceae bacterium]|nr:protein-L-isoaspartate(D-aspartate) O-methyltransferase [Steroidobacteraceae bacterium]
MRATTALLGTLLAVVLPAVAEDETAFAAARQALLREIESDVRETADFLNRRQLDDRVMAALAAVPRHEFIRREDRDFAYENRPLPIGFGQTISQPYIVAVMSDLVEPAPGCRALEVGTGSGYQAAVLSRLCAQVYTLEIVEPLGRQARERLARLGYDNVAVRIGDGYYGWPDVAPFDVIVVTAVAGHVPPPLLKQLKPGGRMVLPVGTRFTTQQLVLVTKRADGRVTTRQMLPVAFVPLTGGHD